MGHAECTYVALYSSLFTGLPKLLKVVLCLRALAAAFSELYSIHV